MAQGRETLVPERQMALFPSYGKMRHGLLAGDNPGYWTPLSDRFSSLHYVLGYIRPWQVQEQDMTGRSSLLLHNRGMPACDMFPNTGKGIPLAPCSNKSAISLSLI